MTGTLLLNFKLTHYLSTSYLLAAPVLALYAVQVSLLKLHVLNKQVTPLGRDDDRRHLPWYPSLRN